MPPCTRLRSALLAAALLAGCGGGVTAPPGGEPEPPQEPPGALLVVGSAQAPNPSERLIRARLEEGGWVVEVVDDDALAPAHAAGKALVVVSKTVRSGTVGGKLNGAEAGVLTWEDNLQGELLGVAGATSHYTSDRLDVEAPAQSPLSAGLGPRDDLVVYTHVARGVTELSWGRPDRRNPHLRVAAANERGSPDVHYYAYDRGAVLDDGRTAPGRRVFFFLYDDSFRHLTPSGVALFDAAVGWAAGSAR